MNGRTRGVYPPPLPRRKKIGRRSLPLHVTADGSTAAFVPTRSEFVGVGVAAAAALAPVTNLIGRCQEVPA